MPIILDADESSGAEMKLETRNLKLGVAGRKIPHFRTSPTFTPRNTRKNTEKFNAMFKTLEL